MDKFRGFNIQVNPDKPHVTVHRIKTVAEYGANVVRIQLNDMESRLPDMEHPQEYEAWLNAKLNAIAVASEAGKQFGVKIIISQHQPFGGTYRNWRGKLKHRLYNIHSYQDSFVEDWSRIAWEFAQDPTIIGYDLLNEPLARAGRYMPLMLRTARSIRVIDQTKKIIVSTPHGNPAKIKTLDRYVAEMKQIGKMWATVHMYWPMNITHQGVGRFKIGRRYPSMKVNSEQLQNYMAKVQLWRKRWRIPVFVGEFSCASGS